MRHKFRYVLAFLLLWAASAFTCGQISLEPLVRDLILRVGILETTQFVAIDANGDEVGSIVDNPIGGATTVLIDLGLETVPSFAATIRATSLGAGDFTTDATEMYHETTDCSGAAYVTPNQNTFYHSGKRRHPGGQWMLVPTSGSNVLIRSIKNEWFTTNQCRNLTLTFGHRNYYVAPLIPLPEMEGRFTPPLEITRRAELPLQ